MEARPRQVRPEVDQTARAEEERLVERAQDYDREALGELYERYFDRIYNYIYHKVGNEADAEDLTEQVFVKLLDGIRSFKWQGATFSSWLYRIAHNACVDHFRKEEVRQRPMDLGPPEVVDPAMVVEASMAGKALRQAIAQLTDEQQKVIIWRFLESRDNSEIAEGLGKSLGAVHSLQYRALVALQKLLDRTAL
jgi:RNA polymerase sigma-70 factor (ECF subfamily)